MLLQKGLEKNTCKYPHQAFAGACICVCNTSKGHLSHFSFRHSRHKQASFLILLGHEEGGGTSLPMETAVRTNWPGELQGEILSYSPASLWPKGMQGRLLQKNDHPPQGPKKPTMGLLHTTFPLEAGEWEVAGGRRTGLNFSVLCMFISCHHGSEKPPQATAALWGEHGSAQRQHQDRGHTKGMAAHPTALSSAQSPAAGPESAAAERWEREKQLKAFETLQTSRLCVVLCS